MTAPRESGWGDDVPFPFVEVDGTLTVFQANGLFSRSFGPVVGPGGPTLRPLFGPHGTADDFAGDVALASEQGRSITRVMRLVGRGHGGRGNATNQPERPPLEGGVSPDAEEWWTVAVSPALASEGLRHALIAFHPAPTPEASSVGTETVRKVGDVKGTIRRPSARGIEIAAGAALSPWLRFMEQMPAIGWIRNSDNRYTYVNPAYLRRYGLAPSDRLGKTPFEVWPKEIAARFHENDKLVIARGVPLTFVEEVPDPDGTKQVWFNAKFPIVDADGNPCLAGLGVNVSNYTRAEQDRWRESMAHEVAQVRVEVEEQSRLIHMQRLTSLSMLVSGAVHDFNNHIAAVSLFATLARENSGNPTLVETYARQIEQAASESSQLCQQLMNSRSSDGAIGFRLVNLGQLIQMHESLVRSMVRAPHQIEFDIPPELPGVYGDSVQLRQVLVNLVLNAAEACGESGKIVIRLRTEGGARRGDSRMEDDVLVLEVVDNGHGIPEFARSRLFEPYFTTKPSGHGIGLSAAAAIAARHRARLELVSGETGGTIARLLIPLEKSTRLNPEPV
jgi:PAS domain S-box-containing protein